MAETVSRRRMRFLPLLGAAPLAMLLALALNASIERPCDESIECAIAHLDASNAHLDIAKKHSEEARRIIERLEAGQAAKRLARRSEA